MSWFEDLCKDDEVIGYSSSESWRSSDLLFLFFFGWHSPSFFTPDLSLSFSCIRLQISLSVYRPCLSVLGVTLHALSPIQFTSLSLRNSNVRCSCHTSSDCALCFPCGSWYRNRRRCSQLLFSFCCHVSPAGGGWNRIARERALALSRFGLSAVSLLL